MAKVYVADAQSLLCKIEDTLRALLVDVSKGTLPSIVTQGYQTRTYPPNAPPGTGCPLDAGSTSSVFEKSKTQRIVVDGRGAARRLIRLLRVLQVIQSLLQTNQHVSKRDIYYTDPVCLGDMGKVDQAINDICVLLGCPRVALNVVAVSKGLVMGSLSLREAETKVDCWKYSFSGFPIPVHTSDVTDIRSDAQCIIVVEKETVFQRLAEDGFCLKNRIILLTGRGYPDLATRSFLRLLVDKLHLPIYGLMDGDPFGLDIICTYRFGSLTMAYDAEALATPEIRWLGIFLTECDQFNIPKNCLLPFSKQDDSKAQKMLEREYLKFLAPDWCFGKFIFGPSENAKNASEKVSAPCAWL